MTTANPRIFHILDTVPPCFRRIEDNGEAKLSPLFASCRVSAGEAISADFISPGKEFPVYGSNGVRGYTDVWNFSEDQVLVGRQGSVGEVHLAKAPFWATEHALVIEPRTASTDKRWLKYVLEASNLARLSSAVAQPGINASSVARQRLPHLSKAEQTRIADYLDQETAEIDAAVADLDRYLSLLEKRKEAFSAAILNKASAHPYNQRVHLGALGLFVSGSGFPHEYQGMEGEELPFYKVRSLSTADCSGVIHDDRNTISKEIASHLKAEIIPPRSVLLAKIGEAMRLCRFVVNSDECCIDNNLMAIVPRRQHIRTDYLRLALSSVTVDVLVQPGPVPSLNMQGLRMFSIPLPSLDAQEKLESEWIEETTEIDELIAESTKLRDLLLKRRSVLITEVVTGRKQV